MIELSKELSYTIISSTKSDNSYIYPFSLLVLNRVNKFQMSTVFKNLSNYGFEEIISVETHDEFYDSESLSQFGSLKTILLKNSENITVGEKINLGIQEANSEFVFVIWSDLELSALSRRLIDGIIDAKNLCTTLVLKNHRSEMMPSIVIPTLHKNEIKTMNILPTKDNLKTLYPFDYVGIYNREKFLQVGGYDENITSAYWQKMDFGLRASLYNETIANNFYFRAQTLINNIETEDISTNDDYKKFYLKNMTIKHSLDHGNVPFAMFFEYIKVSKDGLFKSFMEFMEYRKWVSQNSFRFKTDYKEAIKNW